MLGFGSVHFPNLTAAKFGQVLRPAFATSWMEMGLLSFRVCPSSSSRMCVRSFSSHLGCLSLASCLLVCGSFSALLSVLSGKLLASVSVATSCASVGRFKAISGLGSW